MPHAPPRAARAFSCEVKIGPVPLDLGSGNRKLAPSRKGPRRGRGPLRRGLELTVVLGLWRGRVDPVAGDRVMDVVVVFEARPDGAADSRYGTDEPRQRPRSPRRSWGGGEWTRSSRWGLRASLRPAPQRTEPGRQRSNPRNRVRGCRHIRTGRFPCSVVPSIGRFQRSWATTSQTASAPTEIAPSTASRTAPS